MTIWSGDTVFKGHFHILPFIVSSHVGYYGLVVITPPRPQTFLCERDNLKSPEWITSIFYMYIDIGERIAHIWKTYYPLFSLLYLCFHYYEVFMTL